MEALSDKLENLVISPVIKKNPRSTDVTVPGNAMYVMGPNMQSKTGATHEVLKDSSTDPRFAITLRYLGSEQPGELKPLKTIPIDNQPGNWVAVVGYPNGDKLLESQLKLVNDTSVYGYKADITNAWGRHENAGRKVLTIEICTEGAETKPMKYRYGGKTVEGVCVSVSELQKRQPELADCFKYAKEKTGVEFNWCHCVYYPTGASGLVSHQDDEAQIAKNSVIAAIVVGQARKIRFMPLVK